MPSRKIPVLPAANYLPDPEFPLSTRHAVHHQTIDLHAHEFIELVVIRGGQAVHFSQNQEYPVRAGDVFVIHTDQAHGYREPLRLDLINIMFRAGKLLRPEEPVRQLEGYRRLFSLRAVDRRVHGFGTRLSLGSNALIPVNGLIDALVRELTATAPGYQTVARALFTQLVVALSRLQSGSTRPPTAALLELEPLLQFLRLNLNADLRLDDLARRAGMSVSTLLRRFRTATGNSPVDFLLRLRLERARETLATTDQRITDVAFASGFRDSNYFTRQFKSFTGLSPRAYRQSLRYLDSGRIGIFPIP